MAERQRKPIIGYIVVNDGYALMLSETPAPGERNVLWIGDSATLFRTRRKARKCIEETQAFGRRYGWAETHRVKAVRESP